MGTLRFMGHTAPIVKGRRRPRYRFNIELPDDVGDWLEQESLRLAEPKRGIILRLLKKEQKRVARQSEKASLESAAA